ncbi:CPBP family intramembrane metalloprotease (plasmid) [Niallia taxi]|uniref:CPBP family intramembrane glutamic endopeptidase n=1 Tax=Niallia taxi TaxID=2499688 RepID=UPI0011A06CC5|nr:CPBP family intramembrane glutamic endopeptidase [Niallia taxi]MDE5052862.1 CPBP family intramembrane metalloprotease [Niallia taxi]MED3961332.1 CPBP family intramembrane metalloprotease [Niallia taxi]WOD65306.1 CPBP family intramembrane metalloprotease [Niallia taxi]
MEIFLWIMIVFVLLYEPIYGYYDFQKFKVNVTTNPHAREKYYINSIVGLWAPTLYIILLVLFTELTFNQIGFTLPSINTNAFGPIITYTVFALTGIYILAILYYMIGYHVSINIRTKFTEAKNREKEKSEYLAIMPVSKREKKLWNYVSITAGLTEEIIYRGFLIFAFSYFFPNLSVWFVVIFASLLFGLAHTYQGLLSGVLRTAIVGLIFSVLYMGLNSIIPLILLHFLIDYMAKLGEDENSIQDSRITKIP